LAVFMLSSCSESDTFSSLARCTMGDGMTHGELQGDAGCLIKIDGKAILINEGWSYSPPGGGFKKIKGKKEAAWQTACRETQEEVWVAPITVEKLLHSFGKYHLFECSYDGATTKNLKITKSLVKRDADSANLNTIKVVLKDPKDIPEKRWRYPEHKDLVIDLFKKLASKDKK